GRIRIWSPLVIFPPRLPARRLSGTRAATITSCPSVSRCCATHSLSIAASSRMRAGLAAEQRGEPLTRRADALFEQDGAFRVLDADLGFLLVHLHANIRHGWPALCGGIDCPGSGCRHAPLDDGTACGANDQCLLHA